jgi:hypothetical protein
LPTECIDVSIYISVASLTPVIGNPPVHSAVIIKEGLVCPFLLSSAVRVVVLQWVLVVIAVCYLLQLIAESVASGSL